MKKAIINLFYNLGRGDIDLICAQLQQQILREGSSKFLYIFRNKNESDLMDLANYIISEANNDTI